MGFLSNILDFMFPPHCVFCYKPLKDSSEDPVCKSCRDKLSKATAGKSHSRGDFFAYCVSPLHYEGDVRESLLRFKFDDCTGYAGTYGKLLADCIRDNVSEHYDLITWAPISSKRRRKRGYDQSMLIAMAAALELGDVAVETLQKRDITAQSDILDEAARRANVSGAYTVKDAELVEGKTILLIDDIITTGATLSECARILRMAGAEKVICATVAQAHRK